MRRPIAARARRRGRFAALRAFTLVELLVVIGIIALLISILLRHGRDLRLTGLRDRAAGLYEINRLADVLPCQ